MKSVEVRTKSFSVSYDAHLNVDSASLIDSAIEDAMADMVRTMMYNQFTVSDKQILNVSLSNTYVPNLHNNGGTIKVDGVLTLQFSVIY